jgi:hypothetical protein
MHRLTVKSSLDRIVPVSLLPAGGVESRSTVFAERYQGHRWVPFTAYSVGGLVSLSRISSQNHFLPDVLPAQSFGYSISPFIVL